MIKSAAHALLCLCIFVSAISSCQAPANDAQTVISAQFGPQFVLLQNFPVLTGDFNGDGSEDAAFVVTSKGGVDVGNDRFHVIDPSSEYFGIGDPKITSQFASPYPGGPRY